MVVVKEFVQPAELKKPNKFNSHTRTTQVKRVQNKSYGFPMAIAAYFVLSTVLITLTLTHLPHFITEVVTCCAVTGLLFILVLLEKGPRQEHNSFE